MEFITEFNAETTNVNVTDLGQKDGVQYARVDIEFKEEMIPEPVKVKWFIPVIDFYSTWSPSIRCGRDLAPGWKMQRTEAHFNAYMPVHQYLSLDGRNRQCIALSDCVYPTTICSGMSASTSQMQSVCVFLSGQTKPMKSYSAIIRIDSRDIPYEEALADAESWWATESGYKAAPSPEAAYEPVDSTWYAYLTKLDANTLIEECKLAHAMGMNTLIVDDGWQMLEPDDGYYHNGDWNASEYKMGDMREFVNRIHEIGMKVMLWFGTPFMGLKAERFEELKDKTLGKFSSKHCNLDPRYPEVREYITGKVLRALTEWGFDGLKLDFINTFEFTDKAPYATAPGMDTDCMEEAVEALMKGIYERAVAINPDVLIEFRQSYVGPAVRQYGNILRVSDCGNDALRNRNDVANLRLTSGKTCIQSDMVIWDRTEPVESAAIQMASCLFSVPQVSVIIKDLPEDHQQMLKWYLAFWTQYRDVLVHGKFSAEHPECRFTSARSAKNDTEVVVTYADRLITAQCEKSVIVNATGTAGVAVTGANGKPYCIRDCMGHTIETGAIASDLQLMNIPKAGMLFVNCD